MDKMKTIVTAVGGVILSWLGALPVPVMALIICNVVDYASGIGAAIYCKDQISSYKSFRGIGKKICMWLLVVVGAVMDILLKSAGESIGMTLPFSWAIAIIVAVWLTCNEAISILENLTKMNIPVPGFLRRIIEEVVNQVEKQGEDILPTNDEEEE